MSVGPDWKQGPRVIDSKATTRAVLRNPHCVLCGGPAATGHHVLARGAGAAAGDDVLENIVSVCGSGTTGCHGDLENAVPLARIRLGRHLNQERPDVLTYLATKLGDGYAREWFARHLLTEMQPPF